MGECLVALAVRPLSIRTAAGKVEESPVSLAWVMVPVERIELPTFGLQNRCSTAELTGELMRSVASKIYR